MIFSPNRTIFGCNSFFLFAYEPDVYRSSGYSELICPIHYYDIQQKHWNEFVYRGGMVKIYNFGHALGNQVIEFNGCVDCSEKVCIITRSIGNHSA